LRDVAPPPEGLDRVRVIVLSDVADRLDCWHAVQYG